jgi:hypothetical protein
MEHVYGAQSALRRERSCNVYRLHALQNRSPQTNVLLPLFAAKC